MRFLTHNVEEANPDCVTPLLDGCAVAAFQEMQDRADIYRAVREAGWEFVPVVGAERATPTAYAPGTRLIKPITFLLTKATVVESGGMRDLAGPDRVKDKYFVGGLFERDGRRFIFGSTHYPASQWHPGREALALKASRRIRRRFRFRRIPVIVAADYNTPPSGMGVLPIRSARRWRLLGGSVPTRGKRVIDYAWGRGEIRVVSESTHETGSGHQAVRIGVAW